MNTNFRNFHRLNCIHEKEKKLGKKKLIEVEIDAVIMLAVPVWMR